MSVIKLQPPPLATPFLDAGGKPNDLWARYFIDLVMFGSQITTIVNSVLGVNSFVLAAQPGLGVGDTGYVGFVSDYLHLLFWDGGSWQWLDGDQPGRIDWTTVDPGIGHQVCDGSATTRLVLGATLTTAAFTTPNLTGTVAYPKSINVYTGVINAASGATADEATHTHNVNGSTGPNSSNAGVVAGASAVAADGHTHNFVATSDPGTAHHHSVGSLDMPNIGLVPYWRR